MHIQSGVAVEEGEGLEESEVVDMFKDHPDTLG